MHAAELQEADHRPGAGRPALPRLEPRPELVITGGPAALGAPLRERRRPGQGTRLVHEHVQVMLEIEDLLLPAVAAGMGREALPVMPDLHPGRVDAGVDLRAGPEGNRVAVRAHHDAALAIDRCQGSPMESHSGSPMVSQRGT